MTKLEKIITDALQEQLPHGDIVKHVWHVGLVGWYADIEYYHPGDHERYVEECIFLGFEIDRALENISNNTTEPPIKDLAN